MMLLVWLFYKFVCRMAYLFSETSTFVGTDFLCGKSIAEDRGAITLLSARLHF